MNVKLILLAFLSLWLTFTGSSTSESLPSVWMPAVSDSILEMKPDFDRQAAVNGLEIVRGGVKIRFIDGYLTLANSVMGRPIAALFTGRGRFEMIPPDESEKYMLQKQCRDTVALWDFQDAVLVFTDTTAAELQSHLSFLKLNKSDHEEMRLIEFIREIDKDFSGDLSTILLPEVIQSAAEGSFVMRFRNPRQVKILFVYDPKNDEDVALLKRDNAGVGDRSELVCAYADTGGVKMLPVFAKCAEEAIDSMAYDVSVKLAKGKEVDIDCNISFVAACDSLKVIYFSLYNKLSNQSVKVFDAAGEELFWQREKNASGIQVYFNRQLNRGEKSSIQIRYSSRDILNWQSDIETWRLAAAQWYPVFGLWKPAQFRLTFSFPKEFAVVSIGTLVRDTVVGDIRESVWSTMDRSVSLATFDIGKFQRDSTANSRGVPIIFYGWLNKDKAQNEERGQVVGDIAEASAYFDSLIAPYLFEKLVIVNNSSSGGEGFPGYVRYGWHSGYYTASYVRRLNEEISSHEVAHQWFGHMIRPKTYHDYWLIEGFAEFFSSFYCEYKHRADSLKNIRFWEMVNTWRRQIIDPGYSSFGYSAGNAAGPLWMGTRLSSSMSQDYYTLVYSKGAYILHMLRFMMRDPKTGSDSAFVVMISDFVRSHYLGEVSTEDFITTAEQNYGRDLSWFFEEYVYSIDLPRYSWRVSVVDTAGGPPEVQLYVETSGAPKDFKMVVPFAVIMEGNLQASFSLDIDQSIKNFSFHVPYKPVDFVFNTHNAVLCTEKRLK